jgi:capsular polysaccharide biosynthesis protein
VRVQLSLRDAARELRAFWWVLVIAAALAASGAYIYTKLPWVEPRWKSSVWIQASGQLDYGNTMAMEKRLRGYAERIRELKIMREVDRNLHLDSPAEQMLRRTKAEPVQDSIQVRIDFEDPAPSRAQQVALEIAEVYTQDHNAREEAELREKRVIFTVLDRPTDATLVWPQTRVIVPAAALLGLLVAAAVVVMLAYLDDTLRSAVDVERELGLALLGQVPGVSRLQRRPHWGIQPVAAPMPPPTAIPRR